MKSMKFKWIVIRYYDEWTMVATYFNDLSETFLNKLYDKLEKEAEEEKHLETFKVFLDDDDDILEEII